MTRSDHQGEPENVDEERASKILAEEQLEIEVDLGLGGGFEARYFTCDFSYDYVRYVSLWFWSANNVVSMEVIVPRLWKSERRTGCHSRARQCINTPEIDIGLVVTL